MNLLWNRGDKLGKVHHHVISRWRQAIVDIASTMSSGTVILDQNQFAQKMELR
jgi:hypothetical protein